MKIFILILMSGIVLSGCAPKNVLDQIQLVTSIGIDKESDKELRANASYVEYKQDGSIQLASYEAVSNSKKDLWVLMDEQSPKRILPGQLRAIIYGKELAEENGILKLVNAFYRDANIPSTIIIAISETTAGDIIKKAEEMESPESFLIHDILEQNINYQNYPKTNLHIFAYDYYLKGKDPVLPILGVKGDNVSLKGIALFNKDKMVGSIPQSDVSLFNILNQNNEKGNYQIEIGREEEYLGLKNVGSRRKIEIDRKNGHYHLVFDIKIEGAVTEYPERLDPSRKKDNQFLEDEIEKELKRRLTEQLNSFTNLGVDPLGIGDKVVRKYPELSVTDFYSQYSSVTYSLKINVVIKQTGGIE